MRFLNLISAAAFAVVGVFAQIPTQCNVDGTCAAGQTCFGGYCFASCNATNTNCPAGVTCNTLFDACLPGQCTSNADCTTGYHCDSNLHSCVPDSAPSSSSIPMPSTCSSKSDCQQDESCFFSICLPSAVLPPTCSADQTCVSSTDVCWLDMCVDEVLAPYLPSFQTCATSTDCTQGNICYSSLCMPSESFPNGAPATCSGPGTCPQQSDVCLSGICIPTQFSGACDPACRDNEMCMGGMCIPKDTTSCPDGCPSGQFCAAGFCIPSNQPTFNCQEYCDRDQMCVGGQCVPIFGGNCSNQCQPGFDCLMGECIPCPLCSNDGFDPNTFDNFISAGFNISDFLNSFNSTDILQMGDSLDFGDGDMGIFPPGSFHSLNFNASNNGRPTAALLPPEIHVDVQQFFSANPFASLSLNPSAVFTVLTKIQLDSSMKFLLNGNETNPSVFDFSQAQVFVNGSLDIIGSMLGGSNVIFPSTQFRFNGTQNSNMRIAGGVSLEGVLDGLPLLIQQLTAYSRPNVAINSDKAFEIFSAVLSPLPGQQANFLINGTFRAHHPTIDADLIVGEGGLVEILTEERTLLGSVSLGPAANFSLNMPGQVQLDQFLGCHADATIQVTLHGVHAPINFSDPNASAFNVVAFNYTAFVSGNVGCSIELLIRDVSGQIVQVIEVLNPKRSTASTSAASRFTTMSAMKTLSSTTTADCTAVWDPKQLKFVCGSTSGSGGNNSAAALNTFNFAQFFMIVISTIFVLFF